MRQATTVLHTADNRRAAVYYVPARHSLGLGFAAFPFSFSQLCVPHRCPTKNTHYVSLGPSKLYNEAQSLHRCALAQATALDVAVRTCQAKSGMDLLPGPVLFWALI